MSKWLKWFVIFGIIVVFLSATVYATEVNTTLTVSESIPIKSSHKGMLGMNETWYGKTIHATPGTIEPNPEFEKTLRERDINVFQSRMAGADSQQFYWKDHIGTFEERSSADPGIVEWIKGRQKINPDVQLTFTLNLNDTLENHKDLVRFLYMQPDDPAAVGSDGVNWAQKRVDAGLVEPVSMKTFEIGNEVYFKYTVPFSEEDGTISDDTVLEGVKEYSALCLEIIEAMRSVHEGLSFSVSDYSYSSASISNAQTWNEYLLKALEGKIEYIVHHKYYSNTNFFNIFSWMDNSLLNYVNEYPESTRPKVYMSEYGYWMDGHDPSKLAAGTNLFGTLVNAKFMNLMLNKKEIDSACLHVTAEYPSTDDYWHSGWDIFRVYKDGNIYPSAASEMFKIFGKALGDGNGSYVVKSSLSGGSDYVMGIGEYPLGSYTSNDALTASVHKMNSGELNVVLVNPSDSITHKITLSCEQDYFLSEKHVLTGSSLDANNLWDTPDYVYTEHFTYDDTEYISECLIPERSIVLLCLSPVQTTAETLCEVKINGAEISGGESADVGKDFYVTANLIANGNMADLEQMVAVVKKEGSVLTLPLDASQFEDMVYFRQCNVVRNTAYFPITFPKDAEAGVYNVYLGNLTENKTKVIQVNYSGMTPYDNVIIEADNQYIGRGKAYRVICTGGALEPTDVLLTVKFGDVNIYQALEFDYGKTTNVFEILLPEDAIAGNYTLLIQKNGISMTENFSFVGDKNVSVLDFVKDENNKIIGFDSLNTAGIWHIPIKNNTEETYDVLCCIGFYTKDGKLFNINITEDKLSLSAGEQKSLFLNYTPVGNSDAVDHIVVFVWNESDLRPLTAKQFIR